MAAAVTILVLEGLLSAALLAVVARRLIGRKPPADGTKPLRLSTRVKATFGKSLLLH